MTPERSDQVVARVVAWHNRHPLAERISADQVHSVGIVGLPFSVQGAVLREVPAPVPEPAPVPVEAPPPAAAQANAPPPEPEGAGDEDAPDAETVVELVTDSPPAASPEAAEPEAPTILDRALVPAPPEPAAEPAPAPEPEPPRPEFRAADLPPRPREGGLQSLVRRLRRQPEAWWPLFSDDFIAPLTPRRVAAWARRHAQAEPPLDGDLPRRRIEIDPQCRRAGDTGCEVELQLITAAIGVGERRVRLLLAPGATGAVLGPRHWSRKRLATGGGAGLAAVALTVALVVTLRGGATGHAPMAALPASAAASAPEHAQATVHADGHAHAEAAAPAASAASAVAAAPQASAASAVAVTEPAAAHEPASAPAATAVAAASAPVSVRPRRGRIEVPPLVARLDTTERATLRQEGRALRGESAQAAERAWALVTAPLADRRQSERVAAQLQAVALLQPVPMRTELLPVGRQWRAVFWPFTSQQDAEKVRLALADKGLKTELMEF